MTTDIFLPQGVVMARGGWLASRASVASRISAPARPGSNVMPGPSGTMAGIGKGNRDKGNSSADLLTPEPPTGQAARIPCETGASMLFNPSKPGEHVLENFDAPMQNRELLLDISTLDTLASIVPHDRLIALAGSYLNGLIARAGRIAALAARDDLALLAREAHDLK